MRKFKLIKEYPGSPCLETIVIERNHIPKFYYFYDKENRKSYFKEWIEDNPEYWEEIVEDFYYLVFTEDETSFNSWEPIRVGAIKYDTDTKKYFNTKEGARDFIIQHKPCLSFNDINKEITTDNSKFRMLQNLSELVKSRI